MPVVKLFAHLRKLAGAKEVSVSGATIRVVLNELVKQSPSLSGILFDKEELRPHVLITLNGHNITDFETPVTEQDHIAVFPPIAGG
jgi:MoaD family protein